MYTYTFTEYLYYNHFIIKYIISLLNTYCTYLLRNILRNSYEQFTFLRKC